MTKRQKKQVRAFQVTRNLPISIDPDIQVGPSSGNFSRIFSENQLNSSCLWLPVDQLPTGMWPDLMVGIFFQLPGPDDPPFIMPPWLDFSDDEELEDEIINISSDEEVEENFPAAAAQEQQPLPLPSLPAAPPSAFITSSPSLCLHYQQLHQSTKIRGRRRSSCHCRWRARHRSTATSCDG